jgi:hypothetical protein
MRTVGDVAKAKNAFQGANRLISLPMVNESSVLTLASYSTGRFCIAAAQIPNRAALPFNLALIAAA